jgi:hypothetical protein
MSDVNIADLLRTDEWAIPDWDGIAARVNAVPADRRRTAWADATRLWLENWRDHFGPDFAVFESDTVQVLTFNDDELGETLLNAAHLCRGELRNLLAEIGRFDAYGKDVILGLSTELYYSYISAFHPEDGEAGGSSGLFVGTGHPHIVLNGVNLQSLGSTLVHEMTHGALHGLGSPLWIEEGIAQYVERAAGFSSFADFTTADVRALKRHWTTHGLAAFWWGTGFTAPGQQQKHSYDLARLLVQLLIEEHQPGFFGFGRRKQARLLEFIRHARASDAGQASAHDHLLCDLGEVAAKFLGPGDWNPKPSDQGDSGVAISNPIYTP